jgi:hypothetical protein
VNPLEILVLAGEIIAAPLLFFFPRKESPVSVPAEIQAQLDAIKADLATIPDVIAARVAAAESAANAAQARNAADTLAAVTDLANQVHAAVGQ